MTEKGWQVMPPCRSSSGRIESAVLDGFGQVHGFDIGTAAEISNRARNAQDAMIGTRRQPEPFNRTIEQPMFGIAQFAVALGFAIVEPGVRLAGPDQLARARRRDTISNAFRRFSGAACAQLRVIDPRHFEFQIDTIKQGP